MPATDLPAPRETAPSRPADPHLFSTNAVAGYHIAAVDGEVGHVADFLIDDATWEIAYLVVDTRNWLPGRHVLVDCDWIEEVEWGQGRIQVNLLRDVTQSAPPYDVLSPTSSEYAATLHAHYGEPHGLPKTR
jgi:hypothetical protein